jgi:hypothetical protein
MTGLVFPLLRGKNVGKTARVHSGHAENLRRDVRRAFGIEALVLVERVRSNKRKLAMLEWQDVRELTDRERQLLAGNDTVKPVDFRSWRRAYTQALADADADVRAQQAAALAGHADLGAHIRYLTNTAKMRRLPEAAPPKIAITIRQGPCLTIPSPRTLQLDFQRAREDSNL